MQFEVRHTTSYVYDEPIAESFNEVRLCPISDDRQICHRFELSIKPDGASLLRRLDFYTNQVYSFELVEPHSYLEVVSQSIVETLVDKRDLTGFCDPAQLVGLRRDEWTYDFLSDSNHVPILPCFKHTAAELTLPMVDVKDAIHRIMSYIDEHFTYISGVTLVETPIEEIFDQRKGVCQDFAHVMIALCRAVGIPARYVSGYFWMPFQTAAKSAHDNTASHAWVECFLPGVGWVGYDPTHNRLVDETYIKVAVGRDYWDIKPLSGSYWGRTKAVMEVVVQVNLIRPSG